MRDDGNRIGAQSFKPATADGRSAPPPPGGSYPPIEAAPDEIQLIDSIKVLYKRRWVAGTVFLIVMLSAVVYTFTATPVYEARTRLLIEIADPNVVAFKKVIEEGQGNPDYYQTQYNILQSRALARRTIESLGLWNSPYLGGAPGKKTFDLRSLTGSVLAFFRPAASDQQPVAETARQSRVIDTFLGNLTVEPIRNSRLVDVKFRSTNRELAARVANQLSASYIEQMLEYKFTASQQATSWLSERLAEQRAVVEKAEAALQGYREQNDAISLQDRENIVVQKLSDVSAAVTRAKTERIQKEAIERQLRAIENDRAALETFPPILGNVFIQRQKSEIDELQRQRAKRSEDLGELHPEMLKLPR